MAKTQLPPSSVIKSKGARGKLSALVATGLLAAATLVVAPAASPANAEYVNPAVYWSAQGVGVGTWGTANLQRFGCGLLHCSTTTDTEGVTSLSSGDENSPMPNLYRVKIQADQPTAGGTVSIGAGGVSVSANVDGTSCVSPYYPSAPGYGYVVIKPAGEFCTARGPVAFSITYKVSGEFRVGSTWSSNAASVTGG